MASRQRGAKAQPRGSSASDGTVPSIAFSRLPADPRGIDASRAFV
jgi:hypothetical protein